MAGRGGPAHAQMSSHSQGRHMQHVADRSAWGCHRHEEVDSLGGVDIIAERVPSDRLCDARSLVVVCDSRRCGRGRRSGLLAAAPLAILLHGLDRRDTAIGPDSPRAASEAERERGRSAEGEGPRASAGWAVHGEDRFALNREWRPDLGEGVANHDPAPFKVKDANLQGAYFIKTAAFKANFEVQI